MENLKYNINIKEFKNIIKKYNILDKKEFNQFITYECNRTNRSDIEFSLILFSINKIASSKQILKKIIKFLLNKVRELDIIGLFDEQSWGIILPSTSYDEAHKFVVKLNENNNDKNTLLFYNIYTYPKIWYDDRAKQANCKIISS